MGAVAGVEPAGGAGEVEVPSGDEPGALFEQRAQEVLGGAGRYGGFQQHGGVRAQPGGQGAGGVAEGGEVDRAVGAEGVGAQITAVRTRPSSAALVVGRKPPESMRRISDAVREPSTGVRPARSSAQGRGSVS